MGIIRNSVNIAIVAVFILAFALRFLYLSDVPKGLYPDETAIGYNAYSILLSGKDEFGILHPIYFKSFDDFKLPFYIYATSLAIKLFGPTDFAVRITSALFGSLSIVFVYFLVLNLSKNKYLALITSLFLTLNPWHLLFSRAGYEVNVATSLMLMGTLFFILSHQKKNYLLLFLSIFSFILSSYTYSVTRLISPIILLTLFAYYKRQNFKKDYKKNIIALLFFTIGLLPLLISFIYLQKEPGFASQKDALLVGNVSKAQFIETRGYFAQIPQLISKTIFNYWSQLLFSYIKNLVSFFSVGFYFISGSTHPNQNLYTMAMFYYFELPFIILGAYVGIKKRLSYLTPFAIWLTVIFFFVSIIISVPNGTRTFPVVIPFTVLSSLGFYFTLKYLFRKITVLRISVTIVIISFMIYSYCYFLLSLFIRYPIESAKDWRSEDRKTVEFIRSIDNKYSHIIFDESSQFFYTSLLYYGKIDPFLFQKTARYRNNGLVTSLVSAGKYSFSAIDWKKEDPQVGYLYISAKDNVPKDKSLNILKIINYPKRPIGIYYDRKIGQLSVQDNAYVIFEKK